MAKVSPRTSRHFEVFPLGWIWCTVPLGEDGGGVDEDEPLCVASPQNVIMRLTLSTSHCTCAEKSVGVWKASTQFALLPGM